jgi:phenylalanyl-tRNA synthetase beta chain
MQTLRGGPGWWHPGRHGLICLGPKKVLAAFGELHPRVLRALDLRGPVVGFTVFADEIPAARSRTATRPALVAHDLLPVERDFAFVVDAECEAAAVVNAALGADKALIADVRVFDEFRGGTLPAGKKSLAIAVRLQPQGATLKEAEIDAVGARIVEKVTRATGGSLRS